MLSNAEKQERQKHLQRRRVENSNPPLRSRTLSGEIKPLYSLFHVCVFVSRGATVRVCHPDVNVQILGICNNYMQLSSAFALK